MRGKQQGRPIDIYDIYIYALQRVVLCTVNDDDYDDDDDDDDDKGGSGYIISSSPHIV